MDSYDNEWVLMLDDDLFIQNESETEKCGENSTIILCQDESVTAPSER